MDYTSLRRRLAAAGAHTHVRGALLRRHVNAAVEDAHSGEIDTAVKKRMLNKLRKYPHLQKALRRFIRNATSEKRKPVRKTHIEKICEILL